MEEFREFLNLKNQLQSNFKCPICYEAYEPTKKIFQCTNGHDICESCRHKVDKCPSCKNDFTGTRNYGLEQVSELLQKLETLGSGLNDSGNAESNNEGFTIPLEEWGPKNYKKNLFCGPAQGKGLFRCLIHNCTAMEPICRLLNHIRTVHNPNLHEFQNYDAKKHSNGDISYEHRFGSEIKSLTKVYEVPKYGLFYFFINIKRVKPSDMVLESWIQIASTIGWSKKVRYVIIIEIDNGKKYTYTDIPYTVKYQGDIIRRKDHILRAALNSGPKKNITVTVKFKNNRGDKKHTTNQKVRA